MSSKPYTLQMINPPTTRIEYHMNDAGCFWSDRDDSITVYNTGTDDSISISGVDADSIFRMCRNLMCAHDTVLDELADNKYALDYAKEMRNALTQFIESKDSE